MQRRAVARLGALPFSRQRLHRAVSSLSFASLDPNRLSGAEPGRISNLVSGSWTDASTCVEIVDPLNGEPFLKVPETNASELLPFIKSLKSCASSGLHNPLKNVERYLLYGDISAKAASILKQSEVENFFSRLIQRVSPKSLPQARGEVTITQKFLENFSGDQVRFLCKSFAVPGNHLGQQSHGYRWPYGPVAIITPFNFPLEIPVLQLLGALYMGNKPVLKVDSKVSAVMEQMLRLLHECGMPKADADFLNCDGSTMHTFLLKAKPNSTLFTGSSRVAETLAKDLSGRVKLEDSGFDWKILGPDVQEEDYVAWVCDQDAYACSGQKCSAQSMLFMHANWGNSFTEKLSKLAKRRKLDDLTIGPLLTVKTDRFLGHVSKLKEIPGAKLLFGGEKLKNHNIPDVYGAVQATAVFVPLVEMLRDEYFSLVTTEIFGPLQVVTEYRSEELHLVLEACQRMEAQLTAAVVSNDPAFLQEVLGKTTNGTTYAGIRARTTGAPQNHWFGPASDPRAAGIGTPEAIKLVWSCHREIVQDIGPIPEGWTLPPPS